MSAGAALSAIENGVTNVAALKGGWAAWNAAGYPVEGAQAATPVPQAAEVGPGASESSLNVEVGPGVMGNPDAPVVMIEYSDYQCAFCGQYIRETMPRIKERYINTGKVWYVYRDFPLDFHPNAQKAAEAARCAGAQDAFWPMHDRLFGSQGEWSGQTGDDVLSTFVAHAEALELDVDVFEGCLKSGEQAAQVAQDMEAGVQDGVRGTPSFLINGKLVVGAYPFENFQQIIDAELARQQ